MTSSDRRLLVIDTAAREIGLALDESGRPLRWLRHLPPRSLSEHLRPDLERLLAESDARAGEIDAIAVVCGPGSFTGLRVGMAFALGLAAGSQARLMGLSTLECLAWGFATAAEGAGVLDVRLATGAESGSMHCQQFAFEAGRVVRTDQPIVVPASIASTRTADVVLVGDDLGRDREDDRRWLLPGAVRIARGALAGDFPWRPLEAIYGLEPAIAPS